MHIHRIIITLLVASLGNAQLPNVPGCSLNCFISALTSDGCSALTDFACHCQKPQLVSDISPCVEKACSSPDQARVSSVVISQCSAVGYPITLPPATTSATSASTITSTAETTTSTGTASSSGSESSTSLTSSETSPPEPTSPGSRPKSTPCSGSSSKPVGSSTPLPSKTSGGSGSGSSGESGTSGGSGGSGTSGGSGAKTSSAYNAAQTLKGNIAGVAAAAAIAACVL